MTETELKLRDAATQMLLANRDPIDEEIVRSCINSFISHGRSITFVMERESAHNPNLIAWYKSRIEDLGKQPLFEFFNAQRVYSIHKGVVIPTRYQNEIFDFTTNPDPIPGNPPKRSHTFKIKAEATMVKSGDIFVIDNNKIVAWYFDNFDDYLPGHSGNVFTLCDDYFLILRSLVTDWLKERVPYDAS